VKGFGIQLPSEVREGMKQNQGDKLEVGISRRSGAKQKIKHPHPKSR
jgi:bifunctional DNA-binding transcriptional regulator/antitoxin component of YhaV-PrlF toxin-antitoxin module